MMRIILLTLFFVRQFAFADELIDRQSSKTVEIIDQSLAHIPQNNPSNNLRRKSGSPFIASGIPLIIEGTVRDINGIPIDGIIVTIVEANYFGVFNEDVDPSSILYDQYFSSTGRSVTNNNGSYTFYTIYPSKYNTRTAHIHFRIFGNKIDPIETDMFFKNNPQNIRDSEFSKLKPTEQQTLLADLYYLDKNQESLGMRAVFDIVLNTVQIRKAM